VSGDPVELRAFGLPGVPEVRPGDDLGALLAEAAQRAGGLRDGDVVCVAHKIVSKAEGRLRLLEEIEAGPQAVELARQAAKDPRQVQAVLDESAEVLRAERGVLICVTRHGFVCANAGVDASNAGAEGVVVLLPEDPDASARSLRAALRERTGVAPAVVITDSFGRAWRLGQAEVAIGVAGLAALDDWRGRRDADGRELTATAIALADEAAAAADLARGGKDARVPVALIRGLGAHVTADDGAGAAALVRPAVEDLFR
jgi:coenzyme F420-0:L-glutamate ligase/coenzyme F420-1:gamma-L-glutamate ligase